MITAKNYAAQAVRGLREDAVRPLANLKNRDGVKKSFEMIASLIEISVHFSVPDGGEVLPGGLSGIRGSEIRLPFPSITVEYFTPGDNIRRLAIAVQRDDGITIGAVWGIFGGKRWYPSVNKIIINALWSENDFENCFELVGDGFLINSKNFQATTPELFDYLAAASGGKIDKMMDSQHRLLVQDARAILSLIEALSCKNVSTEILQPASKSNDKRIRKGKLPFYETRSLVINAGKTEYRGDGQHQGGTHASPRQHLRRGHIRRLPSGNYWVNSCVVGDPTKGKISKRYEVTA